jgi:hypothetical protein
MYYANSNPTELFRERHELLMREAEAGRLARRLRAARRAGAPEAGSGRWRPVGLVRRWMALSERAGVPFFRA